MSILPAVLLFIVNKIKKMQISLISISIHNIIGYPIVSQNYEIKNNNLYIYWQDKTGVFENYFHPKHQMSTTSGFRCDDYYQKLKEDAA